MVQSGANRKRETIIDENLKRVYDEAVEQAVPDQFRVLLEALKQQEQDQGSCK